MRQKTQCLFSSLDSHSARGNTDKCRMLIHAVRLPFLMSYPLQLPCGARGLERPGNPQRCGTVHGKTTMKTAATKPSSVVLHHGYDMQAAPASLHAGPASQEADVALARQKSIVCSHHDTGFLVQHLRELIAPLLGLLRLRPFPRRTQEPTD